MALNRLFLSSLPAIDEADLEFPLVHIKAWWCWLLKYSVICLCLFLDYDGKCAGLCFHFANYNQKETLEHLFELFLGRLKHLIAKMIFSLHCFTLEEKCCVVT